MNAARRLPWSTAAVALLAVTVFAAAVATSGRSDDPKTPPAPPARPAALPAPAAADDADRPARPRGLPAATPFPGDPPSDDQLYVWPLPEKGTQTVLVLRVVDGESVEGAYLVPALFRLVGGDAPKDAAGGKAATDALAKLVAGRLLPARLDGRDAAGRVRADFWLGKGDKDDPGGWAARRMLDAKFLAPPK